MENNIERQVWANYLDGFNKRNELRPTWLQVIGGTGAQSEEQGLPFAGISLEERGANAPRVQIILGAEGVRSRHLTHMISGVARMTPHVGSDGREDAIEFVDKDGEASLLIFRHRARMAAHV